MKYGSCSVSDWSGRVQEDTADAIAILVEGDSEVSLLTPGGTPGVSDKEVLFAVLATISNSSDSVILIMAASLIINDTLVVEHEGIAFSIDTNAGWLLGDSSLQLRNTLLWNSLVALNANLAHVLSSLASLMFSFVWIV